MGAEVGAEVGAAGPGASGAADGVAIGAAIGVAVVAAVALKLFTLGTTSAGCSVSAGELAMYAVARSAVVANATVAPIAAIFQ